MESGGTGFSETRSNLVGETRNVPIEKGWGDRKICHTVPSVHGDANVPFIFDLLLQGVEPEGRNRGKIDALFFEELSKGHVGRAKTMMEGFSFQTGGMKERPQGVLIFDPVIEGFNLLRREQSRRCMTKGTNCRPRSSRN